METSQTTSQRALVIEDDVYLAEIYARALDQAGYQATAYYDGQTALDELHRAEETPTLVLIDFHLPLVSGREILRYIRDDQRFAQTRIILVTADSAAPNDDVERRADLVLLKPISFAQLRDLASRFR